jgi:glyoxylase-like metal-dependent hydrolase (beta-lactamase superfamily II)
VLTDESESLNSEIKSQAEGGQERIQMSIRVINTLFVVLTGLFSLVALVNTEIPASEPAIRDLSNVEIKTAMVGRNFYTLEGQGGMGEPATTGALVGSDGVLLVDTQFAQLTGKIVAAVKQISDRPIRFVINTHVHGDHTGGNEILTKMGAVIFARDELRQELASGWKPTGDAPQIPAPSAALPLITYTGHVTFHMDSEEVEAIPMPQAHTAGDTLVRFHVNDLIMTGDFYRSVGFPNVDLANGGTFEGTITALNAVIAMADPNTKIIPGHGPIVSKAAVVAHRDMILAIRDRVALLVHQGKTVEQVLAAHPTSGYDAKIPMAAQTSDRFVRQLYTELTRVN